LLKLTRNGYRVFDDVTDLLAAVRRAGVQLGLITNGAADTQREKLRILDLERWFDVVLISGEVGIAKPQNGRRMERNAFTRRIGRQVAQPGAARPFDVRDVGASAYRHGIVLSLAIGDRLKVRDRGGEGRSDFLSRHLVDGPDRPASHFAGADGP
jgi:phosphoglycolate phosphatase-like HAD superfamily hydrolase